VVGSLVVVIALAAIAGAYYMRPSTTSIMVVPSIVRPQQVFTLTATRIDQHTLGWDGCELTYPVQLIASDGRILSVAYPPTFTTTTPEGKIAEMKRFLATSVGILPKSKYDEYAQYDGKKFLLYEGFDCMPGLPNPSWLDTFKRVRSTDTSQYIALASTPPGNYTVRFLGTTTALTIE
jgi:hypothetical protein